MSDKQINLKVFPMNGIVAVDLRMFGLETERDYSVTIKPWRKSRSNNQNRYYWSCIVREVASHTGHCDEEIHEFLKGMFLSKNIIVAERICQTQISTSQLNTVEFEEYLTKCREWAAMELGIYIGLPNEYPEFANV